MTNLQPAVRIFLTFLVAALATLAAMVDEQTIRLICAPIIAGLAAVGITPPQVPTRTVVSPGVEPVNVVHDEKGQADPIYLLVVVIVVVILLVLLFRVL